MENKEQKNLMAMDNYFDSLPEYLRENIKQSDVQFKNVDELRKYAENMMRKF